MPKTFSILICALNEEKNIGSLLQGIEAQEYDSAFQGNFVLEDIMVISDGSTDRTAEIVRSFSATNPRIKLVVNERRIGKIFSLGKGFKLVNSDYLILFDADVLVEKNTISNLLASFLTEDYLLVGGNPIPCKPSGILTIAEQSSSFSWLLLQEIKKRSPDSIYSAHGRILCLAKKLYKSVDIDALSTPGDDQYLYLKSNHKFKYEPSAVVYYKMPLMVADYLKQNTRFRRAQSIRSVSLGSNVMRGEFRIEHKASIFLKLFVSHPYKASCWLALYLTGYFQFTFAKSGLSALETWGEVRSTK